MIKIKNSPNFDERADGQTPSMIVLHYTGMETASAALARLCNRDSKVSAHYFIDEDGALTQLVEESQRAWHAGVSYWDGGSDLNAASIGVEIVNPGHEFGYKAFEEVQIEKTIALCQEITARYGILPCHILAHSDIAPERKTDPGELFPWERLAESGVGLWPGPQEMDFEAAGEVLGDEGAFLNLLVLYGYNPQVDFEELVRAFHRHFYPDKFAAGHKPEDPDILSAAKLLSLIRQKHALLP